MSTSEIKDARQAYLQALSMFASERSEEAALRVVALGYRLRLTQERIHRDMKRARV